MVGKGGSRTLARGSGHAEARPLPQTSGSAPPSGPAEGTTVCVVSPGVTTHTATPYRPESRGVPATQRTLSLNSPGSMGA